MSEKNSYKVVFINQEQVYEVFVKNVYQAELYGFVVIEEFVFGEKSSIVVDPGEEKLKLEFAGVERSFIPVHKIIRIDQVKKQGTAKMFTLSKEIAEGYGKVSTLFSPDKT
ncbi:MAG: DUF1820 family protein [Methylovulum sp.]|nr:DUF1820 family protein [Methylovulum sp.]